MASRAQRLFGTDEAVEAPVALRAGPLAMQLRRGRLQHIRCIGRELWHGLGFVFRDTDWGTPEPVYDEVEVAARPDGFSARLRGRFPVEPPIALTIDIEGDAEGRVRFDATAVPAGDILCNRIGLCLLHPMSVQGARLEVEHVDGRLSRSTFPTLIPPWPPFTLVRALRHEWADGHSARVELHGDLFEMEDQRNNADASFKTYSRSNMAPRPYRLSAGVPIRQQAVLSIDGAPSPFDPPLPATVRVRVGDALAALPPVGIEIGAEDAAVPPALSALLHTLRPAHLHLCLRPETSAVDWDGVRALLDAAGARLRLDVDVGEPLRAGTTLSALGTALAAARLVPEAVAVFPSDAHTVDAARQVFAASAVGGGTPHFFVQLNRLEAPGEVDFLNFTTSPIVHGADDHEVMLSLQSLPSMIETLQARDPGRPVRVGPSTIAARASPLGRQPPTDGTRRLALAAIDPRCRGLFGAAWTLGHVAQFAHAGVQALTMSRLAGPSSGIAEWTAQGALRRHPSGFVLERLGRPARRCDVHVADPLRIAALALERGGAVELLLANLSFDTVTVELDGWAATARVEMLDGEGQQDGWAPPAAGRHPGTCLRLPPLSIARVEPA